jgi:acetylornithine deacetylase/succinyl-diaminopimelate desuccinylase-like protein
VTARGKGGHASAVNVESATHRLIAALARVVEAPPRWRVSPAARAHFAAVGRFDPHARTLAANLDAAIGPQGPRRTLLPGMAGYFLDTVQVTGLEASREINVAAAEARATIDARLLPDTDGEAFLAELRKRLGPGIEIEVLLTAPAVAPSPSDTPFFAELARALGEGAPTVPAFIAGITDSRWFRERGIPAYGVSPFELEVADTRTVHGADERIPLAAFERGVERMRRIVRTLVEGPAA